MNKETFYHGSGCLFPCFDLSHAPNFIAFKQPVNPAIIAKAEAALNILF